MTSKEWKKCKLGDIADVTKLAGFEFTKYINYDESGEIIALRALNLRNGILDLSDIKRIKKSVSDSLTRSKLYINDILLTYTGNGYGDCAIIKENDKYHLAPNICKISPKIEIVDPYYLYSYIRSKQFYTQMTNNMVGSGQPTIPMKTIRILEIPISSKNKQQKIAKILSAIDDKIELNNSINNNLEQQIFTIFDNIFPNVRDGENTISNYFSPKRGKNLLSKNAILGDVPVIAGGLNPATYHNVANTNAPVITISASGANAGFVNLWHIPVWSSDSSYIDNTITSNIYFWYVMLKKRQQEIFDSQTGSAQPHIYPQHIEGMTVSDIDMNLVNDFNDNVTPLFINMGENTKENQKLIQLRDTLLPKLMNGEIDVSEVDISTDKLLFREDK